MLLPKLRFDPLRRGRRFDTTGYWWYERRGGRVVVIHIEVRRGLPRVYKWAVTAHELVEALYCWLRGIDDRDCDRFDAVYEKLYRLELIPRDWDAGDNMNCPYWFGHQLGKLAEWLVIRLTWSDWRRYCRYFASA